MVIAGVCAVLPRCCLPCGAEAGRGLLLIGSGPEENHGCCKLVQNFDLGACAEHRPWLDRAELLTIYQQAAVFFFPSHEGAGMVVAEAMSYGVPVLCYAERRPRRAHARQHQCPENTLPLLTKQNVNDFADPASCASTPPPQLQAAESAALSRRHVAEHHTWGQRGQQLQPRVPTHSGRMKKPRIIAVHLLNDRSGSPLVLRQALEVLARSRLRRRPAHGHARRPGLPERPARRAQLHALPYRWSDPALAARCSTSRWCSGSLFWKVLGLASARHHRCM